MESDFARGAHDRDRPRTGRKAGDPGFLRNMGAHDVAGLRAAVDRSGTGDKPLQDLPSGQPGRRSINQSKASAAAHKFSDASSLGSSSSRTGHSNRRAGYLTMSDRKSVV